LRVLSTFALRFLIPRLSDFRTQHPSIPVRIHTGFAPVDFAREDVELSIQLGSGNWPGTRSKLLFESWLQPMCSPRLLRSGRRIDQIDDLRGCSLLFSKNHAADWQEWLRAKGRPDFSLSDVELVEFSNSVLTYQAAAHGVGIALGQLPLLLPDLRTSVLVPLLGPPVQQGGYYAVWREAAEPTRNARQFLSWLDEELRQRYGARLPEVDVNVKPA
jgi:LysR family glycine cleavage system transcriptional activator